MTQTINGRLIEVSSVHVTTNYSSVVGDIGMRGVQMGVAGDKEGIKCYRSLANLEDDYDIDTPVWNQAKAYFDGVSDGAFFVRTYDPNYTAAQKPALEGVTTTDNSASVALSGTPTSESGFIHALSKYYYAGAEYHLFLITSEEDKDMALTVSNFVEAQDRGILLISMTTEAGRMAVDGDFDFLEQIKANRATKFVSLPVDDDANNTMGADALGHFVGDAVGANFKFTTGLSVTPQDRYELTNDDLMVYEKRNIGTYATENGKSMITNGRMMSGLALSTMVTKDAITNDVIQTVSDYLQKNRRVPYADTGIKAIRGLLMGILDSYVSSGLIKSYTLNDPDADNISEDKKATGVLDIFAWSWESVPTIDDAEFAQTLVVYNGQQKGDCFMASITNFTDGSWDAAKTVITVDGVQPTLFASGDVFTLTFTNDLVTISMDIFGHGIAIIHHDGSATFQLNLTALDEVYNHILKDYDPAKVHVIDVMTPVEHVHIDSAYLPKLPPVSVGSDAPARQLEFNTPKAIAEPVAAQSGFYFAQN